MIATRHQHNDGESLIAKLKHRVSEQSGIITENNDEFYEIWRAVGLDPDEDYDHHKLLRRISDLYEKASNVKL